MKIIVRDGGRTVGTIDVEDGEVSASVQDADVSAIAKRYRGLETVDGETHSDFPDIVQPAEKWVDAPDDMVADRIIAALREAGYRAKKESDIPQGVDY